MWYLMSLNCCVALEEYEGQLVGLHFPQFYPSFVRPWFLELGASLVGNASFDGWVKYQGLMDDIISSYELTEGRK